MENKKAAIIIVNWNGKKILKTCLDSIQNQTYQNFEVFFVDNGSEDESADFVKKNYSQINLIELKENTGFAKGNNVGIKKALENEKINYIIPINNDTRLEPDFVEKLINKAKKFPSSGSIAPKMKYFYEPDLVDSVGILIHKDGGGLSRGNKEEDRGQYDETEEVFGACGGAALLKRKMLEDIEYNGEYFDNDFFAYYEDLDLAWRARLRGWKSYSCPEAVIYHVHSATGVSYSPFKARHVNRNRFLVIIKNHPFFQMLISLFILTPIRYCRLFNSMRCKKGPTHELSKKTSPLTPLKIALQGWLEVIKFLPRLLRKRKFIQKNRKIGNKEIEEWFAKYSAKMEDMIYK